MEEKRKLHQFLLFAVIWVPVVYWLFAGPLLYNSYRDFKNALDELVASTAGRYESGENERRIEALLAPKSLAADEEQKALSLNEKTDPDYEPLTLSSKQLSDLLAAYKEEAAAAREADRLRSAMAADLLLGILIGIAASALPLVAALLVRREEAEA
jgi:hypothetical protein